MPCLRYAHTPGSDQNIFHQQSTFLPPSGKKHTLQCLLPTAPSRRTVSNYFLAWFSGKAQAAFSFFCSFYQECIFCYVLLSRFKYTQLFGNVMNKRTAQNSTDTETFVQKSREKYRRKKLNFQSWFNFRNLLKSKLQLGIFSLLLMFYKNEWKNNLKKRKWEIEEQNLT